MLFYRLYLVHFDHILYIGNFILSNIFLAHLSMKCSGWAVVISHDCPLSVMYHVASKICLKASYTPWPVDSKLGRKQQGDFIKYSSSHSSRKSKMATMATILLHLYQLIAKNLSFHSATIAVSKTIWMNGKQCRPRSDATVSGFGVIKFYYLFMDK